VVRLLYLYATLAPFLRVAVPFPPGKRDRALLSAFATYARLPRSAVRSAGLRALATSWAASTRFLLTILVMGASTRSPSGSFRRTRGSQSRRRSCWCSCGSHEGLALGGEYGERRPTSPSTRRRPRARARHELDPDDPTLGFLLSLIVIGLCRARFSPETFASWGWRVPFLLSLVLLAFSVYIRMKLAESPVFQRMKASGKGSKSPLRDSFLRYPNNKYALLALLGATAGQGVVWYTGQFYALFFLIITLKLDYVTAYTLVGLSLLIGTPFFVLFGRLSDRIGRLKIILVGCLIAALTYIPLFKGLTHFVNPALEEYQAQHPITVASGDCGFHVFVTPGTVFSPCDRVRDFLTSSGLSFTTLPPVPGQDVLTRIGDVELHGWDEARFKETLKATGYPPAADTARVQFLPALLVLVVMVLYVTMVYGPIAAFLVELFPTKIRYTSMSLPYHIGNGWFGGMLPLLATAMVARSGNIYGGLWYPIAVALLTVVVGRCSCARRRTARSTSERALRSIRGAIGHQRPTTSRQLPVALELSPPPPRPIPGRGPARAARASPAAPAPRARPRRAPRRTPHGSAAGVLLEAHADGGRRRTRREPALSEDRVRGRRLRFRSHGAVRCNHASGRPSSHGMARIPSRYRGRHRVRVLRSSADGEEETSQRRNRSACRSPSSRRNAPSIARSLRRSGRPAS
jgi:hypothetical protein